MGNKPEEPSGSYSETSYIFKSNDESLSFTELLPKLGLSTSLFGLPSVQGSSNNPHRPKTSYSSFSSSAASLPMGNGPVYKVAVQTETYKPSYGSDFHSANHATQYQPQVTGNSPLHTTINGESSIYSNAGGKPYFSSSTPLRTSSFNKLPNYNFPSAAQRAPVGIAEEVVVGKPVGNTRPSVPQYQHRPELVINPADYSQESGSTYEYPSQVQPEYHEIQSQSGGNSEDIHSSQSDHKFGHITTNYYIPHTIQSEGESKKPFEPSPQVEYFVQKNNHDEAGRKNYFRNHYVPSEEAQFQQKAEEQRIEYHTESAKTEEYFLPKLHPTYTAPTAIYPSPDVAHGHSDTLVYQENPTFTSYFKFGTNVPADSKRTDPRPHSFPRTETSISYGTQFKPNPDTSFSAYPTPNQKEEKPTAAKTYYTIKEEPLDYNPFKSAPIALLKPQYANQENNGFGSKFQSIGQKPSITHREFSTKKEAEKFVHSQILGSAGSAVATIERRPNFKYMPSTTNSPIAPDSQNSVNYPDSIYIKSTFPQAQQFAYPSSSDNVKPVVEKSTSTEIGQYSLPDAPNFDNAHLDLGVADSVNTGAYETSRTTIVRPSVQLKKKIASKKISPTATNQEVVPDVTLTQDIEKPATNQNYPDVGSQVPSHSRPNHIRQQQRRKQPNTNNSNNHQNSLQKLTKNLAKDQPEPLSSSEKSQTSQTGERKRRLNPRQKMISCERQCIQNNVSQEYDPVCGNDGKTYSNKGKLQCTQKCGKKGKFDRTFVCLSNTNLI